MTPNRLGRFTLMERLGRGSMGEVWKASDDTTAAVVAIKIMNPELSSDGELVERFRREALSMSVLVHPNIARVYDHGQDNDRLYMVMELLTGQDLGTLIQRQEILPLARKVEIMTQCCSGMAFVHACGVVHRDLKPANIHITREGDVKIMDFGLARIADSVMTQLGTIMGSPSFMAPEVVMGKKADSRSDVFSLGAVFYELLAGRRAFPGKAIHQIMMSVMSGEPAPLAEVAPAVPASIVRIVSTCLRKKPEERYPDAGRIHIELVAAM